MTITRNPFDAGGYSLAEMTQAINILPNLYTRLGQIGLFRFEGVTQRSIVIEQREGVLSLLPSVPLGAPATVGTREQRSMRSFALPWIPHDDVILPANIQGMPALGVSDAADPLVDVMNRKLTLMRRKHAQTREYMEMNALRGIVKDGAGTTLYNYFTEFGLEQISVDFVFGTAGTKVQAKVRTILRALEDNLLGETMTTAHALVSSEFFDKLIGHPKTEEAYKYFSANGGQPLREDMRRAFPFAGLLFEEYNGSVTLSNGTTERLIPAGEGIAFPLGTFDTFTTYGGPANLLETANTVGLPLYARQQIDSKGRWIDLMTESSILPVNKRPRLAIRLHSSN
ncbi:major capsid protein [Roseovarius gahaiensis]|uniref:Major capsid protein n=1 Tax=Roseovarius gahaiensis TaxID=2716691 RepID=A0A967EGE9_9RHOB|nr:major capsid protein [Roseovarius gahaiensis]NHQ74540.1 major capsid protein [Roseovarius gahaiensis]